MHSGSSARARKALRRYKSALTLSLAALSKILQSLYQHVSTSLESYISRDSIMPTIHTLTLSKLLRLLADDPMSRVDVRSLKVGKEPPTDGQRLITDIVALRASHNQRRALISRLIRIAKRKVSKPIQ